MKREKTKKDCLREKILLTKGLCTNIMQAESNATAKKRRSDEKMQLIRIALCCERQAKQKKRITHACAEINFQKKQAMHNNTNTKKLRAASQRAMCVPHRVTFAKAHS